MTQQAEEKVMRDIENLHDKIKERLNICLSTEMSSAIDSMSDRDAWAACNISQDICLAVSVLSAQARYLKFLGDDKLAKDVSIEEKKLFQGIPCSGSPKEDLIRILNIVNSHYSRIRKAQERIDELEVGMEKSANFELSKHMYLSSLKWELESFSFEFCTDVSPLFFVLERFLADRAAREAEETRAARARSFNSSNTAR